MTPVVIITRKSDGATAVDRDSRIDLTKRPSKRARDLMRCLVWQ